MPEDRIKIIALNKKAHFDYFIEETIEAGIVLYGTEVKSVRQGKVNLKDSFAIVENNEIWAYNIHISPYEQGNIYNKDPLRQRKLLLNRREINKLAATLKKGGYTLIPTKVYLKGSRVKIEIAVAKGKKLYDKRDSLAKKTAAREMEKEFKARNTVI